MDLLKELLSALPQSEIAPADLPELDLYMDQIITLFSDKGADDQAGPGLLTKTMINNYSKEGLIKPVKGKKYTKDHILQMLMVYRFKQTLSMQQIKTVMDGLTQSEKQNGPEEKGESIWRSVYDDYQRTAPVRAEQFENLLAGLGLGQEGLNKREMAQMILELAWFCDMGKRVSDCLVQRFFGEEKDA